MNIIADTSIFLAVALNEPEKEPAKRSPFDVPGVSTDATTTDIVAAVRESREL